MLPLGPGVLTRVVSGVARRTVRRTRVLVLRAGGLVEPPAPVPGVSLVRLQGPGAAAATAAAMWIAGDRPDLVERRLADGHELFGWEVPDRGIVSFGWACHGRRSVGPVAFADRPGRVCLYNFHTLRPWRGKNLYPSLLLQIRWTLAGGSRELIIDVNARNVASRRGIEKAGFVPVGSITYLTLFGRWDRALWTRTLDPSIEALFERT